MNLIYFYFRLLLGLSIVFGGAIIFNSPFLLLFGGFILFFIIIPKFRTLRQNALRGNVPF
ncbi:hypothetical protein HHG37_00295 [Vibrio aestuarianus subsp. francensis]|uniref:hypothetical protein n=1 Tax=Vibrio aestuarianus TaxID=28171 RepID=UPI00145603A5|nr:hypothetical protein [Vibrio aestuarianus]NLS56574.1 hypothetical protein [Vibrio aestuarianus subsp. francensis]